MVAEDPARGARSRDQHFVLSVLSWSGAGAVARGEAVTDGSNAAGGSPRNSGTASIIAPSAIMAYLDFLAKSSRESGMKGAGGWFVESSQWFSNWFSIDTTPGQ